MTARAPVKVALVGVGVMGRDHARILATTAAADLVACVDVDPAARERTPPGIPFTDDLGAVLDTPGLEALFVVTPQRYHEENIRAALERGLYVFSEKPMAHTLESADRIVAMGEQHAGRLVFGHMMRFDPRWNALHRAVADGRIGRVVHLSTHGYTPDYEGRALADHVSLVNENAIHGLDLLQWLGGPIQRVYGEVSRTGVVGEGLVDSVAVTLKFASGAVGSVQYDWALPTAVGVHSQSRAAVVGSNGVAWIDATAPPVTILSVDATPEFPGTLVFDDPSGAQQGLYRVEDEYFLAMVRDGRSWPIDLAAARSALAAALAVDRSIELGRPVDVAEMG